MSELRQRRVGMLDFAKGGWAHQFHILDGNKVQDGVFRNAQRPGDDEVLPRR